MIKRSQILDLLWLAGVLFSSAALGQAPAGYYDNANNLEGEELRQALHQIIESHSAQSYNSLWNHFEETDQKPNGQVWDMYSENPEGAEDYTFNFGSDQCGNYGGEGDCYNREHSFPKSWFNDQSPMNTDLFHIYPTDGYVNGIRANHPFGEVGTATYTSANGSKRGDCIYPGYSDVVFEPIDEYKGDFARSYFYMITRYENQVDSWESPMINDNDFSTWAKNLLLEWSLLDPVSQKEIDRNNAVFEIQDNRNPFIDNPGFIQLIWGEAECLFYNCGCVDEAACNYNPSADIGIDICDYLCYGCTEESACNYDPQATLDDGSCEFSSCTCAADFDSNQVIATSDLLILLSYFGCAENCSTTDLDSSGTVGTSDLLILLSGFGQDCGD